MSESNANLLRTQLLNALQTFGSGPRVISTHICAAIATLAVRLPSWKTVIADIAAALAEVNCTDPDMYKSEYLLQFLAVFPEAYEHGVYEVVFRVSRKVLMVGCEI